MGENADGVQKDEGARYTCTHCKTLSTHSTNYAAHPCKPRKQPKVKHWHGLRLKEPAKVKMVVRAWGWGKRAVRDMEEGLKVPARGQPREALFFLTTWFRDLTEENVEPNPGPRAQKNHPAKQELQILSINTGGEPGAWRTLADTEDMKLDVVLLQEVNMGLDHMNTFARAASKKGWTPYYTLGRSCARNQEDARVGGAVTLVKKGLKSAGSCFLQQQGGQCTQVQVGPLAILNVYVAHTRERPEFLQEVFETQAQARIPYVAIGDWNEEPSECARSALQTLGGSGDACKRRLGKSMGPNSSHRLFCVGPR